MSGSFAALNPEAAAIARRRALADRLMAQATQQDFRNPLSIGATIAQSLAGALTGYRADQDQEALAAEQRNQRNELLKPFVRMLAGGQEGGEGGSAPAPVMGAPAPPAPRPAASGGGSVTPPADLLPLIEEASRETGIPRDLLVAKLRQESNFDPNARGRAGEIGLAQIMPTTAQRPGFGVAPVDPARLSDPRENILFGARYLAGRGRAAGVTDWNDPAQQDRALAAYNGGGDPNYVQNVRRWMGGAIPATAQAQAVPQQTTPAPQRQDQSGAMRALILQAAMSDDPTLQRLAPMLAQMSQRDQPNPVSVAPGATLFDPRTRQPIFTAPDRPQRTETPSGPFAGSGMDAQANNIVLNLAPRIRAGTASVEEQAIYQRAYAHLAGGTIQYVNDPSDPSGARQIAVRVPRDMGDLPPPSAPAAQQPAPATPPAGAIPAQAASGNDALAAPNAANAVPGLERTTPPPNGFRWMPDGSLEPIRNGPQDQTRQPLTETAARSNLFGQAMLNGEEILSRVRVPSSAVLLAWRNAPESLVNMGLSANDQQYFNALRQFAAGILRKETGAAFSTQELLDVQSRFFPMPGDDPETQAQKAQARRIAIEAMRAEVPGGFRGLPQTTGPGGQGVADPPSRVLRFDAQGRPIR